MKQDKLHTMYSVWLQNQTLSAWSQFSTMHGKYYTLSFCFISLFMWQITLTDFCMWKHPCTAVLKPTWLSWMTFLMCFWNRFVFYWVFLHICSWLKLASNSHSLLHLWVVWVSGWHQPHKICLAMFLFFYFVKLILALLWKSARINSSL